MGTAYRTSRPFYPTEDALRSSSCEWARARDRWDANADSPSILLPLNAPLPLPFISVSSRSRLYSTHSQATYPISLLEEACKKYNVPDEILEDGGFGVADIGETIAVPVREDGAQDGEGGQGGKDPSVSESEVKEAVEST